MRLDDGTREVCGLVSVIGDDGLLVPLGPHKRCRTLVTMLPDSVRAGKPGRFCEMADGPGD